MSDSEKPEGDLSESDAVRTDEDGEPRAIMETLQKGGSDKDADVDVLEK
jgi:hypothetical protein